MMETWITTPTIEAALRSEKELRSAAERWRRAEKKWSDRAMLTDAILDHFDCSGAVDEEDRILVFRVAQRAAARL